MASALLSAGIQYTGCFLEVALFAYVILFGHAKRLLGVTILLGSYVAIDCIIRPYTLHFCDFRSRQYFNVYWFTDVVLTLEWFGVICFFFRRAFQHRPQEWERMRRMLFWAFMLVMCVSSISLYRSYRHTQIISEFQQNLYFACLVLNTLLYVKIQAVSRDDEELVFLVCGAGLQFAPSAACLAFSFLTRGHHPPELFSYVTQACSLAILLLWFYAIAAKPKNVELQMSSGKVQQVALR